MPLSVCFKWIYSLYYNLLGYHWMGTDNGAWFYACNKSTHRILGFNLWYTDIYIYRVWQCTSPKQPLLKAPPQISIPLKHSKIRLKLCLGNLVLTLQAEIREIQRILHFLYRGNLAVDYTFYVGKQSWPSPFSWKFIDIPQSQ